MSFSMPRKYFSCISFIISGLFHFFFFLIMLEILFNSSLFVQILILALLKVHCFYISMVFKLIVSGIIFYFYRSAP